MSSEYQRDYLVRLPLPLAQLYDRAHNAKDARARYDNTFYLFEALIKLATAPAIACYLHEVGQGSPRSNALDRVLAQLALPSLGQWVGMLRELSRHFGQRPDASSHPLGHLWGQLDNARRDRPALLALYQRIKHGADGQPAGDQSCSLLKVFDALVQYRNDVFHGGPRFDSFFTGEMGPLLFPAANEILSEGTFEPLGPRGSRLVYVNAELRQLDEDSVEVGLRELIGKDGERAAPLPLGLSEAVALAGHVAVVWPGRQVPLRLDPLLLYREGERSSDVLFLNRDLNGRQVQYLNYSTGRTERDRSTAPALAALLSRITGREVSEVQLEALAEQSRAATPSVESLFGPAEPVSRVLGGYEILAEIGRGGMGVVFLARQLSLGRLVALKMLPTDLAGDEVALSRFRRELRLLARCEHPSIVMILDSGTMPDGQLYYAMEYIPGCNLDQVWRELSGSDHPGDASTLSGSSWNQAIHSASRKAREQATRRTKPASPDAKSPEPPVLPLPPLPDLPSAPEDPGGYTRRVVMLVCAAARALQAIHDQGIVHRDVKPANLMLTPDGSRVVLMDFGLAKGQSLDPTSTRSGGLLGTLRYAAPEQLAASRLKVGPTADVRGLGVVLWELLTRRRLFGESGDERALSERIFGEDVPRLRTIDPTFARDLEAIVARATERRAADRIATAGQLAEYLQLYIDGKQLPIRPPTTAEMVGRWMHEHRALVASAAVAGLIVLVTILTAFLMISGSRNDALENAKKANLLAAANGRLAREEKAARRQAVERLTYVEHSAYNMQFARVRELLGQDSIGAARMLDDVKAFPESLRDFTWGYFHRLAPRIQGTMPSPRHEALAVAFAPDGQTLASGGGDALVKVWKLGERKPLSVFQGHKGDVTSVAFSPNGQFLASAGNDGTVRLWGESDPVVFQGHSGPVACLAFAPDGLTLASAGDDKTVKLWDLTTRRSRLVLAGHTGAVFCLAFSPDGRALASGSGDKTVKLWNPSTGREHATLTGHPSAVASVAFSSDGRTLASGDFKGGIRTWDFATCRPLANLAQENVTETIVGFLPKDETLISATQEGRIAVWDLTSGQPKRVFWQFNHRGTKSLTVSPDGQTVATSGSEGRIAFLNPTTGKDPYPWIQAHSPTIDSFKVSRGGGALALELSDGTIELRDITGPQRGLLVHPDGGTWQGSRFSPDGRTLLTSDDDETVGFWDAATGLPRAVFRFAERRVGAAEFAPDGETFAVADTEGTFRLWDVTTGQERIIESGHSGKIKALGYAPDGKILVTADDHKLRLWDAATSQSRSVLNLPEGLTGELAFAPDGRTLALGAGDHTVRLLDVATGRERAVLRGHEARVQSLLFAPDGRTLASTDGTRTVRLWDVATGREREAIESEKEEAQVKGFALDGKRLVVTYGDGVVSLYDVETGRATESFISVRDGKVVISPDGRMLAGSGGEGTSVWDVATGKALKRYPAIGYQGVAFMPDSRSVVSVDFRGVYLLDTSITLERSALEGHSKSPVTVAFSPDGRTIASAGTDWMIKLWDARGRRELTTLAGSDGPVFSVAFSPDGLTLASGGADRRIRLWDLKTGWERASLVGHDGGVFSLAYTSDGKSLVSSDENSVLIWDVATSRHRATLRSHDGWTYGVTLSPDGRTLATAGFDRTVRLWDVATGREERVLVKRDGVIYRLTYSPDGQMLAGEVEGGIQVWDAGTGRELAFLRAHDSRRLRVMTFSPDGRTLASGGTDRAVRLWDAVTSQERASLTLFGDRFDSVSSLSFSPDGRTLASAGVGPEVSLWDASEALPRATAPVETPYPTMTPNPVRERYVRALLVNLAKRQETLGMLDEPISFSFWNETPLEDVMKYVASATARPGKNVGLRMYLAPDDLRFYQSKLQFPVLLDREGVPLGINLKAVFGMCGLEYSVEDMVFVVTRQGTLRRPPPSLPPIGTSDAPTRALLVELEQVVPLPFAEATPLGEVLEHIRAKTKSSRFSEGIPIEFDPSVLAEKPEIKSSPILLELEDVPLRLTLKYILDQWKLSYSVSGGRILIGFERDSK